MYTMSFPKKAAFSSDYKYFACFNSYDKLTVWETSSNACIIDCKLDSEVYGMCTSMYWIPLKPKHPSPKKLRSSKRSHVNEDQLLAIGTHKGAIVLYNITAKNLYSHLVGRHSDAINDMSFYSETDSFFTCSSDKSIAVWTIGSGKQKSHWVADDSPIISICVLDADNMLSASKSILWWKISEKAVVKKFSGHSSEIFKLLAVNAELSLSSCYFLSAAVSESRINAWSLSSSDCEAPVASFVFPGQPEDIDISKMSLKEKHLMLSVVTKEGSFNLFEHTLNGSVNQPVHPKMTIEIAPNLKRSESDPPSIVSTKFSGDSNSCIVAYGDNKDNMILKHIKIKDFLKSDLKNSTSGTSSPENILSEVKESSKIQKDVPVNGLKSPSKSEVIPKAARLKSIDTVMKSPQKQQWSFNKKVTSNISQVSNISSESISVLERLKISERSRTEIKDSDIKDPSSFVGMLLKGIQEQNEENINAVLQISDPQLISECVKNLPVHTLQIVLQELNSRLQQTTHLKFSYAVRLWITEIMRIHLSHLLEAEDSVEVVNSIDDFTKSENRIEIISKGCFTTGVLRLVLPNKFSDKSDSESDMES